LTWINRTGLLQKIASMRFVADQCATSRRRESAPILTPESTPMIKISFLVWIILGTALAGTAVIAVLAVPTLALQAMKNIPFAVLIGFVAAMPLSYLVARKIGASSAR
jgi:hypothetical protein